MPAEIVSLLAERRRRAAEALARPAPLPMALSVHGGTVVFIVGTPATDAEMELWLSPEEAEDIGRDLIRFADEARAAR